MPRSDGRRGRANYGARAYAQQAELRREERVRAPQEGHRKLHGTILERTDRRVSSSAQYVFSKLTFTVQLRLLYAYLFTLIVFIT